MEGWRARGWVAVVLSGSLVFWAVSVNTCLSRIVRIQAERGHEAVRGGPYRWVRHLMYLGIIIIMLGIPLSLGSGRALVPAALIGILFIIRTALEDKTRQAELPGSEEYTR